MFESAFCQIVFYIFALLAAGCALGVVISRNPVTSAMNMALCFGFVAAIFFGLGAQFLGIVQLIVYAGAILVLFLFVTMMLDIKAEEKPASRNCCWLPSAPALGAVLIGTAFFGLVSNLSLALPGGQDGGCPAKALCSSIGELALSPTAAPAEEAAPAAARFGGALPKLDPAAAARSLKPGISPEEAAAATSYPDVKLLAQCLYTRYNIAFVILGFALLAGTVGATALARRIRKN
ncbi:MAG: NADH-quinone oxidoreductase subunit J [Akkermansia sp.]